MPKVKYIAEDLVKVKVDNSKRTLVLAWGDPVEVLGRAGKRTRIKVLQRGARSITGTVAGKLKTQSKSVLKFVMADVQQGDGMVMESPKGRLVTIDGGDNKLFARYLADRFRFHRTTEEKPLTVDAMVITHGDADHFTGLNHIVKSEKHETRRKQLFIHPTRVYHNGLVKGSSKVDGKTVKDEKMFGKTVRSGDELFAIDLEDDLREVDVDRMNRPFKSWVRSLRHWGKNGEIEIRHLAHGDGETAFDFLADEDIEVEVLGPITKKVTYRGKRIDGLPFLHKPSRTVTMPDDVVKHPPHSASHTINGHSIVLRVKYKNVRFLLAGDLNEESMKILRRKVGDRGLKSEILKVPHHGSADFDVDALKAMSPVVSLISSGDENSRKEYIHPRATLMGALGWAARGNPSLVFSTELAAFFEHKGRAKPVKAGRVFEAFERTSFGIIHVRTDGRRVLVFTHSGKENLKEAYRFTVDSRHRVRFAKDVKKR